MGVYGPWQGQWGIVENEDFDFGETPANDRPTLLGATGLVASNPFLPLIDKAILAPNWNLIDQRKQTGSPQRYTGTGGEFLRGNQSPTVTLPLHLSAEALGLFGSLLMQGGVNQEGSGTQYKKTMLLYESADPVLYSSVLFWLSEGQGDDPSEGFVAIDGAICKTLSLSGQQGQPVKLSAEMVGWKWQAGDSDTLGMSLTPPSVTDLMFSDMTAYFGYGTSANIIAFDLSITNNAKPDFRNGSQYCKKILLQDLTGSGSITIPFSEDDYTIHNDLATCAHRDLKLAWGTDPPADPDANGELLLDLSCIINDPEPDFSQGEMAWKYPFILAASTPAGADAAVRIVVRDNVERHGISGP